MAMITSRHYWKSEFPNRGLAEAAYEELETRMPTIRIKHVKEKVFVFDTSNRTGSVVTDVTTQFGGHAKLYKPRPELY